MRRDGWSLGKGGEAEHRNGVGYGNGDVWNMEMEWRCENGGYGDHKNGDIGKWD